MFFFFFFNDTATTEIYTLSLHDALPIWIPVQRAQLGGLLHYDPLEQRLQGGPIKSLVLAVLFEDDARLARMLRGARRHEQGRSLRCGDDLIKRDCPRFPQHVAHLSLRRAVRAEV